MLYLFILLNNIMNLDDNTLSNINVVGLMGKIGSGKSTIQKLLLSLHNPTEGTILIDNIDILSAKFLNSLTLPGHSYLKNKSKLVSNFV